MADEENTLDIKKTVLNIGLEIDEEIKKVLGDNFRYVLLAIEIIEGGKININWATNLDRNDMVKTLRVLADSMESGEPIPSVPLDKTVH